MLPSWTHDTDSYLLLIPHCCYYIEARDCVRIMVAGVIWCFLRDQCGRGSRTYKLTELNELGPDEWLLADLAKELGIKMQNIHAWLRRGWVTGRQIASSQRHWILWADKKELERLHQLSKLTYRDRPYPKSLTTPRKPPSKE